MEDLVVLLSGDGYCSICLKTSGKAQLVCKDYGDFFEAIQTERASRWVCGWCTARLRCFYQLRATARRSRALLNNIRFGSFALQANEKYYKDELEHIQREKYVQRNIPPIHTQLLEGPGTPASTTKNSGHSERCSESQMEVFSYEEWSVGRKSASDEKAEAELKVEPEPQRDPLSEDEETRDAWDGEGALARGGAVSATRTSPTRGVRKTKRRAVKARACKRRGAAPPGPAPPPPLPPPATGLHLQRADMLRRDINMGKAEVVLNEQDSTVYIASDVVARHVRAVTLSEAQERAAHAERLRARAYTARKYQCQRCATGFATRHLYDKHATKHSPCAGEFRCAVCETYHASRPALSAHAAKHYRAYRCGACGHRAHSQQHASNHYFTQHGGITFRCAHCNKAYKSLLYLKKHFASHNKAEGAGATSTCGVCGKLYDTSTPERRYRFTGHVRSHEEGKVSFECVVCKMTVTASRRSNHMKRHAAAVACSLCHNTFKCKETLQNHIDRIHLQHKKFQCDTCGKLFFGKSEVRTHIEWTHMRLGGVACTLCGLSFRKPYILRQHTRAVHHHLPKPKDKLCDICGKGFTARPIMEQHRLIHTGDKPHGCAHCGRRFRQKCALQTHVKLKHMHVKWSDLVAARRRRTLPHQQHNHQHSTSLVDL